jgi:hypothetical protein
MPLCEAAIDRAVRWLIDNQRDDGSWTPSVHLRIPKRDTITPVESEANINLMDLEANMTTAAVLAALLRVDPARAPTPRTELAQSEG